MTRTGDDQPILLTQANFVGQGFDITRAYAIPDSLILPILDPSKAKTKRFDFLGTTYTVPAYVMPAIDTTGVYVEDTVSTREDFQDSIAVSANVDIGYGAFTGEMEASYGREYVKSSEFMYSYRNFYSRLATLSLQRDQAATALSDAFCAAYQALPRSVTTDTLQPFVDFFHDFGIYVTDKVSLGASFEYYVAVAKSSELSETDIGASVRVEYKALFASGGVSTSTSTSDSWQKYTANRTVHISVAGGDSAVGGKLGNIDPDAPSMDSVALFNQWLDTIKIAPAIADFSLLGVWDLIPDPVTKQAVQDAFRLLKSTMRPRLVIETTSKRGVPPNITLGQPIRPDTRPAHPIGFQMVVFDRTDVSPTGLRFDKYYGVPEGSWFDAYEEMYRNIVEDIVEGGFDSLHNVLVLATYGMNTNAPPNLEFYSILRSAGGGSALRKWVDEADPGSSMDLWPGSFIQVGVYGLGPDTGVELLQYDANKGPTNVQLEVYFYRQRGDQYYTFSLAGRSTANAGGRSALRRAFRVAGKSMAFVEAIG